MTREVPVTSSNTLRFLLRGLFGLGSRAECLAYLLTHDGGHPSEVSKNIGLSVRGTQDALIELSRSGLVLTRVKGKRKIEYWLSQERWWEFLSRGSMAEINFFALQNPDKVDRPMSKPLLAYSIALGARKGEQEWLNFLNAWVTARQTDKWLSSTHKYWFNTLDWSKEASR